MAIGSLGITFQAAKVPILPAIVDFKVKLIRLEKLITEVTEVDRVITAIQEFAATATPNGL